MLNFYNNKKLTQITFFWMQNNFKQKKIFYERKSPWIPTKAWLDVYSQLIIEYSEEQYNFREKTEVQNIFIYLFEEFFF